MKKLLLILIVCFGLNAFGQTAALNSGLSKVDIIGLNTFTVPDSLTTNKPTKEATMCRKGKKRVNAGLIVTTAAIGMIAIAANLPKGNWGLLSGKAVVLILASLPVGIFGLSKTADGLSMRYNYCE